MRYIELFCNKKKFKYDGFTLKRNFKTFEPKGDGLEANVYKVDKKTALKVYKDTNDKAKLNKKMIEELSTIDTNRIILPNDIITTEDGKTKGYSMDYVEETDDSLEDFNKDQLIRELQLLKEDLIELGEKNIEIGDLREENTISNKDSFYLIDCGDYLLRKEDTTETNIQFFNDYIVDMFTDIVLEKSTNLLKGLEKLRSLRIYLSRGFFIGDYLEHAMNEEETINTFVRRMVK